MFFKTYLRMNKNFIIPLMALAICPSILQAKVISPSEARAIASKYIPLGAQPKMKAFKVQSADNASAPDFYVFNDKGGRGFVLVAGDDCIFPVLGYSPTGSIDNNMPPQLKAWLEAVSADITSMRENAGGVAKTAETDEAADDDEPTVVVAPLIKTHWNQKAPYNDLTPTIGGKHCMTGCVATSLAQVFNYYKWPEKGTGVAKYSTPNCDDKEVNLDLSQSVYDWADMKDDYSTDNPDWTEAQGKAVATLMRDLGAALHMAYGVDGSGAWSYDIGNVINKHFGYKAEVFYLCEAKSNQEWMSRIKKYLDAGDPLSYAGQDLKLGGHQFVIDGYDSRDYLHVNWGWSGNGDGYYTFSKFGSNTSNFNTSMSFVHLTPCRNGEPTLAETQTKSSAVTYLKDADGKEVEQIEGSTANFSATLNVKCQHPSLKNFDGNIRLCVADEQGNDIATLLTEPFKTTNPYESVSKEYALTGDMFKSLADGSYRIVVELKDTREDGTEFETWKRAELSNRYPTLSVKDGNLSIAFVTIDKGPIKIKSLTFDKKEVTFGESLAYTAYIENENNENHLWDNLLLMLISNDDPKATPVCLDKQVISAFAGMENKIAGNIPTLSADISTLTDAPLKAGMYTVMALLYNNDSYKPVEIDGSPVTLTVKDDPNPTHPYITDIKVRASLSGDEYQNYDVSDGKVADIPYSDDLEELQFIYDYDWFVSDIKPYNYNYSLSLKYTVDGNTFDANDKGAVKFEKFSQEYDVSAYGDPFSDPYFDKVIEWNVYYNPVNSIYLVPVNKKDESSATVKIRIVDTASGVNNISSKPTVKQRFDIQGCPLSAPAKGLNIVRMSDGNVKKIMVR